MNHLLDNYIESMKDKIIHSTCEIINIPSVFEEDDMNAPFGKHTVEALEYVLALGKSFGFRTKNIDNMCGYIEFGEGDKMLGIIGHLDVVPAEKETWNTNPFEAQVIDNNIYGRGAIDDKGPVIATLYAMKAIADNYHLDKRVRLILGLNEENNWKCIQRYKKTEELPTIAFSPDANFPCIYAEKTIESLYLKQPYTKDASLYIENISTNDNAINVVPKFCEVVLGFDSSIDNMIESLEKILANGSYSISYEIIDNSHIKLTSLGTASHAAHPNLGKNAISPMIIILHNLFDSYHIHLPLLDYFVTYIGDDFTGKKLGIDFEDESGELTLNTAQFILKENILSLGFNLRIPVTIDYHRIKEVFKKYSTSNITVEVARIQDPLLIKKTDPLVQKLCAIFNDYNHSQLPPEAIGGGTYARAFDNCISFGPQMPGAKDMCHQSNEYISIDNLLFCTKVYAQAILEL